MRPCSTVTVSIIAADLKETLPIHIDAAWYVLWYLTGSADHGLSFSTSSSAALNVFTDSNVGSQL